MKKIVIATFNKNKAREYGEIMAGLPLDIVCLEDYKNSVSPEENGKTFQENALIKARYAAELTGEWALGDDTGLEVQALGGEPGIYSARYAGPECNSDDNCSLLLAKMQGLAKIERSARFVCCLALAIPGGNNYFVHGIVPGLITESHFGSGGFGYDSLFLPDGHDKTFAQMLPEEKNAISHRRKALQLMLPIIEENLKLPGKH